MSNSEVGRLLAAGYRPLWHDGNLIYSKRDDRTSLEKELGLFDGSEIRPSLSAYAVAMREAGLSFGLKQLFVRVLLTALETRPLKDGASGMIEYAARSVPVIGELSLRDLAAQHGFRVDQHPYHAEAAIRDIIETFPTDAFVRRLLTDGLKKLRNTVFF